MPGRRAVRSFLSGRRGLRRSVRAGASGGARPRRPAPIRDPEEIEAARARLDELRRRLYAPGASTADRAEFAALQAQLGASPTGTAPGEQVDSSDEEPTSPAGPTATRRRRRILAAGLVVGLAVVAAVGIGTALTVRADPPATTRGPRQSIDASPRAPSASLGSSTPSSQPTAAPPPTPATLQYRGATIPGQQSSGGGSAVVTLDVTAAPSSGGTLLVLVTSSDPSPVGWVAQRRVDRPDHSSYAQTVAAEPPALSLGATTPVAAPFEGAPPTRLVVQAPTGVGWTVTVAFAREPG